jgi:hypothetical protein
MGFSGRHACTEGLRPPNITNDTAAPVCPLKTHGPEGRGAVPSFGRAWRDRRGARRARGGRDPPPGAPRQSLGWSVSPENGLRLPVQCVHLCVQIFRCGDSPSRCTRPHPWTFHPSGCCLGFHRCRVRPCAPIRRLRLGGFAVPVHPSTTMENRFSGNGLASAGCVCIRVYRSDPRSSRVHSHPQRPGSISRRWFGVEDTPRPTSRFGLRTTATQALKAPPMPLPPTPPEDAPVTKRTRLSLQCGRPG